nr:hypothetical protein [Tanacetum cinerariifolium]
MSNTNTNLQTQISSALHNDTISSCSISKVQEKARLSKAVCMKGLKALQSHFTSLLEKLKDNAQVATFKRTFTQDIDLLEKQLTKEIIHEIDCKTALTELRTMFNNTFNSDQIPHLHNYTAFETILVKDTIIGDMDFIKNGTESEVQDKSSRSRKDTNTDDADIRPIYDKQPKAEVQLTAESNVFATGQQHTEQPNIITKDFAKPTHMIASSSSRNSSKNLPRFSSNDMVHNHYLDEARKKIQERIELKN